MGESIAGVSRRTILGATVFAAAAGGGLSAAAQQRGSAPAEPAPRPPTPATISPLSGSAARSPFVLTETASGRVRGLDVGGIKQFKGIPYGAPTSGRNRFMPPQPPQPWAGVRDCFDYGQISPQVPADPRSDYARLIEWDEQSGGMGEDCLNLNVYTPGVRDGKRRPVMVSFHGGGFTTGSNNLPGFYGDPLARFGDVVVVTPNHRLASFGYLHLADLGAPPEFARAGAVGMMDLVAVLQWVRQNAEAVGGDPNAVMIWGQSGGGAKTSVMLGMPSAKGLFHRAAVQSGSLLRVQTPESGTRNAELLLRQLGLPVNRIGEIQRLPWGQILDAQTAIGASATGGGFSPVLDGVAIPRHPFDPTAPEVSADVPVIISSALEDAALSLTNFDLDEAGLRALVAQRFGGAAERILSTYRQAYPAKSPYLVQAQIFTDAQLHRAVVRQAERKAALGRAPAYVYLWEWPTPASGGKFGAVHGTDVGTAFHSSRGAMYGETPEAQRMADRHAAAWVAFARTGSPNGPGLPRWEPYTPERRATMVFDTDTRLESDHRRAFRLMWDEINPAASARG